jgi:hypothetical protein
MQTHSHVPQDQLNRIEDRLNQLEKMVSQLMEKVEEIKEPPQGTAAWWEWAEKQADAAIKTGDYVTLHSKEELQQYLDSLKNDD